MSDDDSPARDPHSAVPAALLPWQKKPRFSWTPAYEATFFQSLCQSVQLGLRENQSFKQEAWSRALVALRDQGAYPTKAHLINKTDNARKKFRLWRGLVENPQFTFNPATQTISGSEEAWQAHLEKEPLARAFRDRPFENAEYLEVLFPDVVGSGGHPKRITRPRRKGPDTLPGGEAPPGTSVMHFQAAPGGGGGGGGGGSSQRMNANIAPSTVGSTPVPLPHNIQSRQQGSTGGVPGAGVQQIRPASTGGGGGPPGTSSSAILPPPPPGASRQMSNATSRAANASASALTPPEENSAVGQKRFAPNGDATPSTAKRRRTEGSIGGAGSSGGGTAPHRNRTESHSGVTGAAAGGVGAGTGGGGPRAGTGGGGSGGGGSTSQGAAGDGLSGGRPGASGSLSMAATRVDGIAGLLSDVLTKYATATTMASTTRWPEQAMETFFQEFADEDMDLQLRIAEKILTDTNKAVMFCKMPTNLRKHWVKRLREVSSRLGN